MEFSQGLDNSLVRYIVKYLTKSSREWWKMRILALSGSLGHDSYNRKLLAAAAADAAGGVCVDIWDEPRFPRPCCGGSPTSMSTPCSVVMP